MIQHLKLRAIERLPRPWLRGVLGNPRLTELLRSESPTSPLQAIRFFTQPPSWSMPALDPDENLQKKKKSLKELEAEIMAMPNIITVSEYSSGQPNDSDHPTASLVTKEKAGAIAGMIARSTRRVSPAAVGLSFELRTCHVLNSYHPAIVRHVGKVGDSGVDFEGHLFPWSIHQKFKSSSTQHMLDTGTAPIPLSPHPRSIPILGQCKAMARSMSPGDLHTFAGMLAARNRLLAGDVAYLGVFVVESGFSIGTWNWVMNSCAEPIALMSIRSIDTLHRQSLDLIGMGAGGTKYMEINHAAVQRWPWLTKRHFGASQFLEHQFLLVEEGHQLPTRMWSNTN